MFPSINITQSSMIIIDIAIILFAGFLTTRITKLLKLPNVTGYIFAGIIIGPYVLNLVSIQTIENMDFVTDIALAFIAFGVGKYLKISTLKKTGAKVIVITVFEALTAAVVIALAMIFIFHLPVPFAILLGAIGSATAPASTIMTIRQYHAKGEFVDMILQVVALDDAVALIAFSACTAVLKASDSGFGFSMVAMPIIINVLAVVLGGVAGFALDKVINDKRSQDHKLVVTAATILAVTGFCSAFDVSPLLSCMAMGSVYINVSGNKDLFKQVNSFTPPILTMFFVLSGMKLNVPSLMTAGIIGVGYFIIRIAGKYAGAYIGATVSKASPSIRKYLGLALIPQAGVSIGLAALGQRMLPADMGSLLSTIILSSAVLYEMIGPASSKAALWLSDSFPQEQEQKNAEDKHREKRELRDAKARA